MEDMGLAAALKEALKDLRKLPPPVVRLSGPLRTGGDGFETNMRRFKTGEALLRSRGMTVFGYDKYSQAIKAHYDEHFGLFHIPILRTKLIRSIFFLPDWQASGGASYERKLCEELGISAEDLSREELAAFETAQNKK